MLAIATTLISLGTDSGKACPVPCGRGDVAATSFAKSFAEGSALAGEVQSVGADGKLLKDAAGDGNTALAKTAAAAAHFIDMDPKGEVSAGTMLEKESRVAKDLITAIEAKAVVPVPKGVKKAIGVEALPQSGKANESGIAAIQIGVLEGQPSSGDVKDVTPEASSGTVDESKTIVTDEVTTPHPDIADCAMLSIPDNGGKPSIRDQKEIRIAEESQEEMPADKVTKDHVIVSKIGKSEKTDKAAGATESVAGAGPQTATAIPIVVFPPNGPLPSTSTTPDENGISSIASTEMKPRVGMTAVAVSNPDKKHAIPGKPDAGEIKAQGFSLPDNPASQKPGSDAEKNTSSAAAITAGANPKELSAVAMNSATAPKHADGLASMAASATGVATVPTLAAGTQPPVGSHVATVQSGAGMQSGASAIDAGPPTDAAHRTLTATPTSLEVGVANGSHGWLKIRAEMGDGGVVNASLSTASPSGQETLHRELSSLAAYLQNEHVAVNAVVVQPVVAAADPRGFGGGVNGDGRGQPQQSGGQGGDNRQDTANTAMNHAENSVPYNGLSGMGSSEQLPLMSYARGGNWLSVRA